MTIPLRAAVARAESKTRGYWVDPQSRLTWAAADDGLGVSWSQAVYYWRTLTAAGFTDWTLPIIEELHGLFGGPPNEGGHHIAGPSRVTGWA